MNATAKEILAQFLREYCQPYRPATGGAVTKLAQRIFRAGYAAAEDEMKAIEVEISKMEEQGGIVK